MEQYIPKSALVAEIERLKSADLSHLNGEQTNIYLNTLVLVEVAVCNIEAKEVDLEKEIELVEDKYYGFESSSRADIIEIIKHFFELGIKAAQKGE